jgi:hypothetical protein
MAFGLLARRTPLSLISSALYRHLIQRFQTLIGVPKMHRSLQHHNLPFTLTQTILGHCMDTSHIDLEVRYRGVYFVNQDQVGAPAKLK